MRAPTKNGGGRARKSVQDLDESDEDWEQQQQRGGGGGGRIPLQPPRDPSLYETEEEWKVRCLRFTLKDDQADDGYTAAPSRSREDRHAPSPPVDPRRAASLGRYRSWVSVLA